MNDTGGREFEKQWQSVTWGKQGSKETILRVTYFLNGHINSLYIPTGEIGWISDFHAQTNEIWFDYLTEKTKYSNAVLLAFVSKERGVVIK